MPSERRYHVFIAYASPDRPFAKSLYEILREDYEVFFDWESLLPGDPWDITLPSAQANSLITIVLISSNVDNAYYQREEIASAIALTRDNTMNHRVIPIYLDSDFSKEHVPYGLRRIHSIYLSDSMTIGEAAKVISRVLQELPHTEIARYSPIIVHEDRLKARTEVEKERKNFIKRVDNLIQNQDKKPFPSCMIFIDIDSFSGLNNRYGISVGNEVVRVVSKIVNNRFSECLHIRWGGDSFMTFFQGKVLDQVLAIAELIRQEIFTYEWETIAPRLYVTASIGIAKLRNEETSNTLIQRAMEGARLSKKQGGNKVMYGPMFISPEFNHYYVCDS